MRNAFVHAIDRDGVLNQVVRADAEEINLAREGVGRNRRARNFDHRADFHLATFFLANFVPAFVQDRFGVAQFLQTGNHREHDLHVADRTRAQDGAQLSFEDVDVLQTKTNGAPTEEWIQLVADIDGADSKFVAAKVERANDERVWLHPFGHSSISLVLFLFARQGVAIHEKKLSPIKSNAFGTVFGDGLDVTRQLDVGRKNNVTAVTRGRWDLTKLSQLFRDLIFSNLDLAVVRKCFRRWIDNQHTGVTIEQHVLAGLEFLGRVVQTDDRRNVERTRDDRSVRSAAAQIGRDAKDELAVHRRRVGRCQIVRDQNVRLSRRQHWFRRFALQISHNAPSDVLNIKSAFAQIGIVDFTQGLGIIAGHFLKNPFDVATFGFKPSQNFVN